MRYDKRCIHIVMPNKLTLEQVIMRTHQQWEGVAELDASTYVDQKTLARFIDCDYGEWWAKPLHIMKGTGRHPLRVARSVGDGHKVCVDDVVKRVCEKHNGKVKLCIATYVNTHTKAVFIDDEYGSWLAVPHSVLSGRGHPRGKLKKAIATMHSYSAVKHWNTGELCIPMSGYEHAVLTWLCENTYDFDWQVPLQLPMLTPKLQKNVVYNVDFYIKSGPFADSYVEVKGTWSRRVGADGGKIKWNWLKSNYPKSQLWMRDDLIRLGIIDQHRTYLQKAKRKYDEQR